MNSMASDYDAGLPVSSATLPRAAEGVPAALDPSDVGAPGRSEAIVRALRALQDKNHSLEKEKQHWEEMYLREKRRGEDFRANSEILFQKELRAERDRCAAADSELHRLREEQPVIEADIRSTRERIARMEREANRCSAEAQEELRRATTDRALLQDELARVKEQREAVTQQVAAEERLRKEAIEEALRHRENLREFSSFNSVMFDKLAQLNTQLYIAPAAGPRGRASSRAAAVGSRRRSASAAGVGAHPGRQRRERECERHTATHRSASAVPLPYDARPSSPALRSGRRGCREHTVSSRARMRSPCRVELAAAYSDPPATVLDRLRRVKGDVPFVPPGARERTFNQLARVQQGLVISQRPATSPPPARMSPPQSPVGLPPPPPLSPVLRAAPAAAATAAGGQMCTRELTITRASAAEDAGMQLHDDPAAGVIVSSVAAGSAASRAGVLPGQELVAVNGARVRVRHAAEAALSAAPRRFSVIVADPLPSYSPRRQAARPLVSPTHSGPAAGGADTGLGVLRQRLQAETQALRDRYRGELEAMKRGGAAESGIAALTRLRDELDARTEELRLLDDRQARAMAEKRESYWCGPPPSGLRVGLSRRNRVLELYRDFGDLVKSEAPSPRPRAPRSPH